MRVVVLRLQDRRQRAQRQITARRAAYGRLCGLALAGRRPRRAGRSVRLARPVMPVLSREPGRESGSRLPPQCRADGLLNGAGYLAVQPLFPVAAGGPGAASRPEPLSAAAASGRRDRPRAALARYTAAMVCHRRLIRSFRKEAGHGWKAVTSLTTGPENPRRRVDPRYARPAKAASLRATDDCGGCDRARLVYVGWGGTSTAPTASPVEGWIAFDRMSGATNFKGEYLGTIIANAGGTGQ